MPHNGELEVVGRRWGPDSAANKEIRRTVQVVFQDPYSSLSPRMTVEEIVGEGLLVHEPSLPMAGRRERVMQALAEVGLPEDQFPGLLQRYPHEFSGGQRQRLAMARRWRCPEPERLLIAGRAYQRSGRHDPEAGAGIAATAAT